MFTDGLANGLLMTMMALYQMHVARLNSAQMVFLGSIFEITILLCEVPTGVVADVYSRKLSVILGYLLTAAAFFVSGLTTPFALLAVGAVLWGVGETFISGAREAWIADEVRVSGSTEPTEHVFVSGTQSSLVARVVGTWGAVGLLSFGYAIPLVVGASCMVVTAVLMALLATEKGFDRKHGHKHTWAELRETFALGFRQIRTKAVVATVVLTTFAIGLTSEAFDRLWPKHFEQAFTMPMIAGGTNIWWAVLNTSALLLSAGVLWAVKARSNLAEGPGVAKVVLGLVLSVMVGMALFAIAPNFGFAVLGFLLVRVARRAIDPLLSGWLSRQAEPEYRATLLSFSGQAHSFGEVMSGPVFGVLAQLKGIAFTLLVSSGILAPLLALLGVRHRGQARASGDSVG